jgi:hypothetical protein
VEKLLKQILEENKQMAKVINRMADYIMDINENQKEMARDIRRLIELEELKKRIAILEEKTS